MNLSAPRLLTFLVSLVLAALAAASILHVHLPSVGALVSEHRIGILLAAYVVLALGVLLPSL